MLIEGGILKKIYIEVIEEKGLRPTKSRIRASVFDILTHKITFTDCYFFDLFAGSGAMGIDAINRGFTKSFFFENNRRIFNALRRNLNNLPKNFETELYFGDSFLILQKLLFLKNIAKVFFVDAPYTFIYEKELLKLIREVSVAGDILIIEKDQDITKILNENNICVSKLKKYGKIYLHFMEF